MISKPAILRLWKRRDVKLVFLGLVLVALTQWSFLRLNPAGEVTLEFVEMVTRGRGTEEGTLAKFRLRNESRGEITYFGKNAQEPHCEVKSLGRGVSAEGDAVFRYPFWSARALMNEVDLWSKFTVQDGEEVMVYARVWQANGPWQMRIDYERADQNGQSKSVPQRLPNQKWWSKYVPQRLHNWFLAQPELGSRLTVASEAVDIKVRGLTVKQRLVLGNYHRLLNLAVTNRMQTTVVTNADGSFELKQVRIKRLEAGL